MIYASSACIPAARIGTAVETLADLGFRGVELSGGTAPYPGLADELLELRARFGLRYRCHNYFPPPPAPFVLNLAAPDPAVYAQSVAHVRRALALSERFGAGVFGVHAGFRFMPPVEELGRPMTRRDLTPYAEAAERFAAALDTLAPDAEAAGVRLYVENNACSAANLAAFEGENPFLLVDREGFDDLQRRRSFALLLDVAHLKVGARSLGRSFEDELRALWPRSDYVHLSDNDGKADTNRALEPGSALMDLLAELDWTGKTSTLEVYDGPDALVRSAEVVEGLIDG